MMSRKRELQWNKTPSPAPSKNTEEDDFLTPEKDTAVFAGTANPHLVMGPGMEAGSLPEAECLTFRAHMGGDTLDAFAPLAQLTQRAYGGDKRNAGKKLATTITTGSGVEYYKTRIREEDYVPESAGLMTAKTDDRLEKAVLRALDMRKSKRQEILASKRELHSTRTPKERSVSPMFGGMDGGGHEGAGL